MVDPYKMVVVNLITSGLLLIGILIYRFIYPKKNINLFFLLILISFLPLISILRAGDYESGDFNIHIYRIMVFYDSLMEGNFMPSWAGDLNATYGNPLFIFNYSLPYYGVSFLHFVGFSFIAGMKIYLGLSLYLSGIFMYLWIKRLTGNNLAALTSSIFYIFNPYHLIDVHFRATLGESTTFTIIPLLLLFITLYFKEKKLIHLVLTSLSCQLLFLAHPMVAVVLVAISILYVFYIFNKKNNFRYILFAFFVILAGVIGSSYSWFSFILYSQHIPQNPGGIVWQFNQLYQFIYSPWRYGFLFQGPKGELAFILGYTQIFVVIVTIMLLITNKIEVKLKRHFLFWLSIMFVVLFFMTPLSKIIWEHFPFVTMLQSNRLLLPIALCTSVIAGYLTILFSNTKKKKLFIYILISITIAYTILNWGHRRVIPEINDAALRKSVWISTISEGPIYFLNNKWANKKKPWFTEIPKQHLEITQGKGVIKEIRRTSTKHNYIIDATTSIAIQENTLYYPGWNLKSNYTNIPIYPGKRGVINARLPEGLQYLELAYEDITPYKLLKKISFISFIILVTAIFILAIKKYSTGSKLYEAK